MVDWMTLAPLSWVLLLSTDDYEIAVKVVNLNPLSPNHVVQCAQSRLGMVLWARKPNPIQEPPIMVSQLVPPGHLCHHHQILGTLG